MENLTYDTFKGLDEDGVAAWFKGLGSGKAWIRYAAIAVSEELDGFMVLQLDKQSLVNTERTPC